MGQRPRELFPERSAVHALGAELRRLRTIRRFSQARLGELVHHSGALIGKIEKAERSPTAAFCARVDAALGTDERLSRMWATINPHLCGVPIELVVSPWAADTSLRLLRDVTGRPEPYREFVALTGVNLDTVLAGFAAATPAPGPADSAGPAPAGPAPSGPGVRPEALPLVAVRVAALHKLGDTFRHTVLRDLAFAELRCLTELIAVSTLPTAGHRRLFGVTADAARLCARLVLDVERPGPSQTYHLIALRCAAVADDHPAARTILTAMTERAAFAGDLDDAVKLRAMVHECGNRKEDRDDDQVDVPPCPTVGSDDRSSDPLSAADVDRLHA